MTDRRMSSKVWWSVTVLIGIVTATVVAFIPIARPVPQPMAAAITHPLAAAYVGDAVCAQCHAEQARLHQQSGHAHTFFQDGLGERFAAVCGKDIPDPERTGSFRFECRSDALSVSYTEAGRSQSFPIQFAVGSGTHATTFLTLIEGRNGEPAAIEHRLSLFGKDARTDLTPSQSGLPLTEPLDCFGRVKRGREVVRCIECHSTTGQVRGTKVADLRPNVGCESCHGPGRQHLVAVELKQTDLAMKFAPSAATAEEEIHLCGQCHRLPEAKNTLPDPDDEKLARFQPVGLMQSLCFRRSKGELRCSTCHNPHEAVVRESQGYNVKCRDCHSRKRGLNADCPVSPVGDCVACHMPAREVHPGVNFHDHWIRPRNSRP